MSDQQNEPISGSVEWFDKERKELWPDEDERGFVRRVLSEIDKFGEVVGSGQEADITKYEDPLYDEICLKRNVRATSRSVFGNSLREEGLVHNTAYVLLNGCKGVAQTPQPLMLWTKDKDEVLAMRHIQGKTLWRLMMEKILKDLPQSYWDSLTADLSSYRNFDPDKYSSFTDVKLENVLIDVLQLGNLSDKAKIDMVFARLRNKPPFLPAAVFDQTKQALDVLHQNGLYHRDLHQKNLMIENGSGRVFIIDFGHSVRNPKQNAANAYEVQKFGQTLNYARDEGILNLLSQVCERSKEQQSQQTVELDRQRASVTSKIRSQIANIDVVTGQTAQEYVEKMLKEYKIGGRPFGIALQLVLSACDLSMFEKYVIFLVQSEREKFGTTAATFAYLSSAIRGYPVMIQNKLHQIYKSYNQ